jgi:hypothetical protein
MPFAPRSSSVNSLARLLPIICRDVVSLRSLGSVDAATVLGAVNLALRAAA